jgi:hypothetical protein
MMRAFHEVAAALALDLPTVEQRLLPSRGKSPPAIIDTAEQFEETHRRTPFVAFWGYEKVYCFLGKVSSLSKTDVMVNVFS